MDSGLPFQSGKRAKAMLLRRLQVAAFETRSDQKGTARAPLIYTAAVFFYSYQLQIALDTIARLCDYNPCSI